MTHLVLAIIYFSFTCLGFSNSLLGSAWPSMYSLFEVPLSYMGAISMIISGGTIVASLLNDQMTLKVGCGKLTAISSAVTVLSLCGFFFTRSFPVFCLIAIPYGLSTGCLDASLNNYIALYYENRHMNWMHCCWGIGSAIGPYMMGYALSTRAGWYTGYGYAAILQLVLTVVLFLSLPLWKKRSLSDDFSAASKKPLTLGQIFRIPGTKAAMLCCFSYNAIEQTAALWSSSYLNLYKGIPPETAASYASMYFIGITIGRALGGFISIKLNHKQMIRLGQGILLVGILCVLLPLGTIFSLAGLIIIGLGSAPIYPSMIHSSSDRFGADKSPAIVGVLMACSFCGTCLMPALFGLIANHFSVSLFPIFLFLFLFLTVLFHEILTRKTELHPSLSA